MTPDDCTAKVTTADVTDETVASVDHPPFSYEGGSFHAHQIPDGVTVQRQGDRLVRVDTDCPEHRDGGPHRCIGKDMPLNHHLHLCECGLEWQDHHHGATPHEDDVTVTDAEVEAAEAYWVAYAHCDLPSEGFMRATLLAAKRAEKGLS